jgi:NADH-quinone oxidoreductase subunit I
MNGAGLIKGLIETARNFAGSYHDPKRLVTVQYPEENLPPVENGRTIPFLVYDGTDAEAGLRCTACQICEKECPPQCIYIVKDKIKKPDYVGKMQLYPKLFDIDVSVCMSCGICVEVCPFDAIKMDQIFELSTDQRFGGLLFDKKRLSRPNEYFGKLHKTEAAEINARREEEKQKAAAAAAAKAAAPAPAPAPKPLPPMPPPAKEAAA